MILKVSPGLNITRERRHFGHLIHEAPSEQAAAYLRYLLTVFEQQAAAGRPVAVKELLPMYEEEFELNT